MTMLEENRYFYNTLLKIAIPITIQNVITSSLNLVDTVMIGQLGAVEVAAVGLANRFYSLFILIAFGLGSGAAVFTAQFWGKKDVEKIGIPMGIALVCSSLMSLVFSLGALLSPEMIMRVFTKDSSVILAGSSYFRIVALSYLLTGITLIYSFVLRSIEHVKLPMVASTTALALNTLLNYCLILGHFGFPALGVKGAAIATLIARIVEVSVILFVAYRKKYPVVRFKHVQSISVSFMKQFYQKAAPVIANEFLWALGMTTYSIVYGRMGTTEIAAVNIVAPVELISIDFFFGLANASAVMIGNQIGAGRENVAFSYAKKFTMLSLLGSLFAGGLIFLGTPYIVSFFNVSQDVRYAATRILLIVSLILWIRVFNMISATGILRGGGDTMFSMLMDVTGVWGIGVPLAFLGAFVFKWPVYWVYALVCMDEVVRMGIGLHRIYSKKWVHNLVGEESSVKSTNS